MEKVQVKQRGWFRRMFAFAGPAYLVSVGYMDPGNWATDIEGGARFGYTLIWVLLMSNIMAVLLQTLSARLGIVTGYDLAQGCRREFPRPIVYVLWIFAEIAIAATDLAEVLGTILGLNLLFGLPLIWGCAVTVFDTFLLLAIIRLGIRKMEAFIVMLIATIGSCFLIEIFLAKPGFGGIISGFVPRLEPGALYVAIGIIGATVMPHNLYLHSSLVQSRLIDKTHTGRAEACRFNLIDSGIALNAAFFVNAAILIMSAANFHSRGIEVTEIQEAHKLLEPILGSTLAPAAFAIALLAAGQSSTVTGTISGQVVMEGFLNIRMRPWLRRLVTRSIAIIPAAVVIFLQGSEGTYRLLILSQVILSLQLPFAVIPLIQFTSSRGKMGRFTSNLPLKTASWVIALIIVSLNVSLVIEELTSGLAGKPLWFITFSVTATLFIAGILVYIFIRPFFSPGKVWESGIVSGGEKIASKIRSMNIEHIGVALERTPGDADVISAALSIAGKYNAKITLIHVVDDPGSMVFDDNSGSLHGRHDQAYLEEVGREIETDEIHVETMLRTGKPYEEIIASVNDAGLDMLILGSHGHRGLSDLVYGETVTSVRHSVTIPLLIIRISEVSRERPDGKI